MPIGEPRPFAGMTRIRFKGFGLKPSQPGRAPLELFGQCGPMTGACQCEETMCSFKYGGNPFFRSSREKVARSAGSHTLSGRTSPRPSPASAAEGVESGTRIAEAAPKNSRYNLPVMHVPRLDPEGETGPFFCHKFPARRELAGNFRRFGRFPPKSVSKTLANSGLSR